MVCICIGCSLSLSIHCIINHPWKPQQLLSLTTGKVKYQKVAIISANIAYMSGPVWECYQCYFLPSSLTAPYHVTCSTLGTMVRCRAWNWIHPALSPDIVNIPGILAMIIHTLAIQKQVDSHSILKLICWNREHGMYPILFKKIRCFQLSHLKPLCDDDEKHMITDKRKLVLSLSVPLTRWWQMTSVLVSGGGAGSGFTT